MFYSIRTLQSLWSRAWSRTVDTRDNYMFDCPLQVNRASCTTQRCAGAKRTAVGASPASGRSARSPGPTGAPSSSSWSASCRSCRAPTSPPTCCATASTPVRQSFTVVQSFDPHKQFVYKMNFVTVAWVENISSVMTRRIWIVNDDGTTETGGRLKFIYLFKKTLFL